MARLKKLKKTESRTKVSKNKKKSIFGNILLLKQNLISTWKSKLQLVIILLLTAFATSLVTGCWISYNRMTDGSKEMGLNSIKFDAILPYSPVPQGIKQIADQAFSLKLGRLYYQETNKSSTKALYFDNTVIGANQQINAITKSDVVVDFNHDSATGIINGLNNFNWTHPTNPLTFNLSNYSVQASIYGQLEIKATIAQSLSLKNHYLRAATDLYRDIFLRLSLSNITSSISDFIKSWIVQNPASPELNQTDDNFIDWILKNKINWQSDNADNTIIPDETNLFDDIERNKLFSAINQGVGANKTDFDNNNDPRATPSARFGMNGHYMRIERIFDNSAASDVNIYSNFNNYFSPAGYNQITDGNETQAFSLYLARGAAALQEHDVYVRNQFNAIVKTENNVQTNTKIIDIGMPDSINHTNLKIFEGLAPTSRNEIAITPQYARKLKYKAGDSIVINNSSFIITGIGGDVYDIYPTINDLDPVPNTRTEFIAYVPPLAWSNSDWYRSEDKTDTTLMYFTPWDDRDNKNVFNNNYFDDFFQKTIFSDNCNSDHNQSDYNNYLITKYITNKPDPNNKYNIIPNPVINSNNSQFSIYSGRLQIFETSVKGFLYASIVAVLFLVLIVIFITTLIVKKSIQHGQVSMGILKSIGYKTWQITASYLAYPLIALVIAIPIGWFVGLTVQVYLTEIFNTLFVLPYNVFNFNVTPLFISIAVIIGFMTIATLLTAFRILKKGPLLLIKKDSDLVLYGAKKQKTSGFLKNHFRWRFLLSLSKTSWKKILVTSSVISLATLSIVATTAIPATINSLKANYFKTQKYKNYYQYQSPIPNLPLSKYGLYAWNFFNKPSDEPYYPVYGAMPWPEDKIIYDVDGSRIGWYNPLDFKANDSDKDFAHIFTFDRNYTKDKNTFTNAMTAYYDGITNGTLDINDLLWAYSWFGGKSFSNEFLTQISARDQTPGHVFSSSLINFASTALPSIIGIPNPGISPGSDAIKEILKQTLPGYVRQSLDSLPKINGLDPYDYFAIGHNTIAFNPNYSNEKNGPNVPEEELVTQFKIGSNDLDLITKGLMDTIGINPDTGMIVLQDNEANLMRYNSSDTTIPMVINKAFQAKYKLSVGSTFDGTPDINTLCYKNTLGKMIPLPKNSWYYGSDPENANNNGGIWSKNATKWNYRGEENIGSTGYSDAQGYEYGSMYDNNGKPIIDKDNPNAWSNMNQVWLKVPDDINQNALIGTIRTADGVSDYAFNINSIAKSTGSKWIKPFSFSLNDSKTPAPAKSFDPLGLLTNRNPEWFMGMLDRGIFEKQNTLSEKDNLQQAINDMPLWWQNITGNSNPIHRYKIVGIQNSYDSPKAYIDQKWANKIVGYSAYDDKPYYDNTTVPQWFSGKLSANDNIFDLIGRMSFKQTADDYTMYATTDLNNNKRVALVTNNDLLSRKQAMLNKMSDIAFSASALFIVTTIICSILIVIMITDLFTNQLRRFMAHMKAEGYTNREINSFTLGIFTPWALLGYLAGFALGFLAVYVLLTIIATVTSFVLPFTITWWILPVSFVIISGIYISTFIINNSALNKMNLIELLKSDE